MKYDDSEYYFLNFETDRDNDDAATHTGMYLAWAILRGLAGEAFADPEDGRPLAELRARRTTGREVLLDHCDGKLSDDDLNERGNAFTQAYYERHFVKDYERLFQDQMPNTGHPTADFCGVPDTWANFDRLAALLDKRFAQWQEARTRAGNPRGGNAPGPAPGPAPAPQPTPAASAPPGASPNRPAATPLSLEPATPPGADELRRRGEKGDAEAWYDLAAMHITGQGAPKDFALAVEAFRRAAELGHLESSYNLGVAYQNGDGVPKDADESLYWFTRAADAGHGFSALMLAQAYRVGKQVPQDLSLANALSMIAVIRGVREASNFGIIAGNPYADLVMAMKEPGTMLPVLERRRASAPAPPASPAAAARVPSRTPAATRQKVPGHESVPEARPTPITAAPVTDHDVIGLLATGIGAGAVFFLLMFATTLSGTPFRVLAWTFAFIGAFGVFRSCGRLGHGMARRILLTLIAAIPVGGAFLCMLVLYWRFRRSRPD